ncbi:MAG: VWA domain-containing protein [Crocinitomicaceae bacterium]|nr:VWA domain-containing protein [Crocinitomicaceae bacterium]
METIRKWKNEISAVFMLALTACTTANSRTNEIHLSSWVRAGEGVFDKVQFPTADLADANTIKIALLLDTSNSMDGLIEQAKSQLWRIVLQLSTAQKEGVNANLKIALYEYGNDALNSQTNWVRQITPFTSDLDEISKQLFELRTFGGSEYCGAVINQSLNELEWSDRSNGLQVMFIAGNEPFDQGSIDFSHACENAINSDIIVNTIYCGDYESGISTKWKKGADITEGFYGTIDMNSATVYIETPYDEEILRLNQQLNKTYITYGATGASYSWNMTLQDANATTYGTANCVDRVSVKCSPLYNNATWDLVDAVKDSSFNIKSIKKEELPVEMQTMTYSDQVNYIELKSEERAEIQKKVNELSAKRTEYILQKQMEMGGENTGLDYAIINAIKLQAMAKNFTFGC